MSLLSKPTAKTENEGRDAVSSIPIVTNNHGVDGVMNGKFILGDKCTGSQKEFNFEQELLDYVICNELVRDSFDVFKVNEKGEHTKKVYVSESAKGKKNFLRNFPSESDKNYDWHNKMSEMAIETGYKIEQKYTTDKHKSFRRADAVASPNQTLEFQNSNITNKEVRERQDDMKDLNIEITWVINGNNNIEVSESNDIDRRYTLKFTKSWTHESFGSYSCIYCDIDGYIYCINPKSVLCQQFVTPKRITIEEFFWNITNGEKLNELLPIIKQGHFEFNQRGAGNGKTHETIAKCKNDSWNSFIILTKQKTNITTAAEMLDKLKQDSRYPEFSDCEEIEDARFDNSTNNYKRRIFRYKNNLQKNFTITIATVDKFICTISKNVKIRESHIDKFRQFLKNIIGDDGRDWKKNLRQNGTIKSYNWFGDSINVKTLFILDEAQDLHEDYATVLKDVVSEDTNMSLSIYGDLGQSVYIEDNAMKKYISDANKTNRVWRHKSPILRDFQNTIINFDKDFGEPLPKVELVQEEEDTDPAVTIFEGETIYGTQDKKLLEKLTKEIEKIMKYVKKETEERKTKPWEMMLVSAIVKAGSNILLDEIVASLREYFQEFYKNDSEVLKRMKHGGAFIHRREQTGSVNLSDSNDCMRIVSIHSSKGDDRPVVFVLVPTERTLRCFDTEVGKVKYASLLHVAITRVVKRMYLRVEPIGDDIHKRFDKWEKKCDTSILKPYERVTNRFNLSQMVKDNQDTCYQDTENIGEGFSCITNTVIQGDVEQIDMKHHVCRRELMHIYALLLVVELDIENGYEAKHRQFRALLDNASKRNLIKCSLPEYREHMTSDDSGIKDRILPFWDIDNKYGNLFEKRHNNLKIKIKSFLKGLIKTQEFDTLDMIVLRFMVFTGDQRIYSDFGISDLHDVLETYTDVYDSKKHHYEAVHNLRGKIKTIMDEYNNLNWLVSHGVTMETKDEKNVNITKKYEMLAYNDDVSIIIRLIPDINELNKADVELDFKFDYSLFKNISGNKRGDNYKRFNTKKLHFCVISLQQPTLHIEPFIDKKGLLEIKKIVFNLVKSAYEEYKNHMINLLKYYVENLEYHSITNSTKLYENIQTIDLGIKYPWHSHLCCNLIDDYVEDLYDDHNNNTLNYLRNNIDECIELFNDTFDRKLERMINKELR